MYSIVYRPIYIYFFFLHTLVECTAAAAAASAAAAPSEYRYVFPRVVTYKRHSTCADSRPSLRLGRPYKTRNAAHTDAHGRPKYAAYTLARPRIITELHLRTAPVYSRLTLWPHTSNDAVFRLFRNPVPA